MAVSVLLAVKHSLNIDKAEKRSKRLWLCSVFFLVLSLLFSALALTDLQLINAFYFPLMLRASPSLHHPFMFNLRMKHFTSNVSRQAFSAQSVPLYIPILSKAPRQRDIHWGGRVCYYMSHHPQCVAGFVWRQRGMKSGWVDRRSHSCSLIWRLWLALWARTRDWQRTRGRNPLLFRRREGSESSGKRPVEPDIHGAKLPPLNCFFSPHILALSDGHFCEIVGEIRKVSVSSCVLSSISSSSSWYWGCVVYLYL